jgi:hypothetical protein
MSFLARSAFEEHVCGKIFWQRGQAPFAGQRPEGGHHACMVVAQMVPVPLPLPENLAAHRNTLGFLFSSLRFRIEACGRSSEERLVSEQFDAYYKWLGIPPEAQQSLNHYRLLGLTLFEPDADVIASAADKQMSHVRSFQSGPHSALSQKLLNEIAAARVCLLNAAKKEAYDAKLRAEVADAVPPPPPPDAGPPGLDLGFEVDSVKAAMSGRQRLASQEARRQRLLSALMGILLIALVCAAGTAYYLFSRGEQPGDASTQNVSSADTQPAVKPQPEPAAEKPKPAVKKSPAKTKPVRIAAAKPASEEKALQSKPEPELAPAIKPEPAKQPAPKKAPEEKWQDTAGNAVAGELVDFDYDSVVLKKEDGSPARLEHLVPKSLERLQVLAKERTQLLVDKLLATHPDEQDFVYDFSTALDGQTLRFTGTVLACSTKSSEARVKFALDVPAAMNDVFRREAVFKNLSPALVRQLGDVHSGDRITFEGKLRPMVVPCPICKATGRLRCTACGGKGWVKGAPLTSTIKMPAGSAHFTGGYAKDTCKACKGSGVSGECKHKFRFKDWTPFVHLTSKNNQGENSIIGTSYSRGLHVVLIELDDPTAWITAAADASIITLGRHGKIVRPE